MRKFLFFFFAGISCLVTGQEGVASTAQVARVAVLPGWACALMLVPAEQKAALQKLIDGMPERDKQKLSADYLLRNTALAFEAKQKAPWGSTIPDDIFLNYVLPYSAIGEEVDDFRADFRTRFLPVIEGIQKSGDAAHKINTVLWKMLDVVYSPKREKPDQSPYHSMRIKMASCTGLSILLIDACRSVGIPARFVGCLWTNNTGNHSWVEVWQDGVWYHLGAFDGEGLNKAWFNKDVVNNIPRDPKYAIFAYAWLPTEESLWRSMTSDRQTTRPVLDVTQRYLDLFSATNACRVEVVVRDAQGKRVVREVVLREGDKQLATGKTYDDTRDLNSHLNLTAPEGTVAQIEVKRADGTRGEVREVVFKKGKAQPVLFSESH
jgi:Transglutaminase-like superfamily